MSGLCYGETGTLSAVPRASGPGRVLSVLPRRAAKRSPERLDKVAGAPETNGERYLLDAEGA